MKTLEEIRAIEMAAREQVELAVFVCERRRRAEEARTMAVGDAFFRADKYGGPLLYVTDSATQEAIRALLIAMYTRQADEAEAKLV